MNETMRTAKIVPGSELVVGPATAKTHVSRVLTKSGARDRAQLVVIAYETGLVSPGSA